VRSSHQKPRLLRWIALVPLILALTGCAWSVMPPSNVSDPVVVYLTDYGRHTSLIMPVSDKHLVEYAFGDWNWFAKNENSAFSGMRALLFSQGSTLGRRFFVHTDDIDELMRLSGAERVVRFGASRDRVKKLTERLDRAYMKRIDTWHFNPLTHLDHVRSDRRYWGLDNCNNVTANWLRELGVHVSGWPLLSKFKVPPEVQQAEPAPAARESQDGAGEKARSPADTQPAPAPPRGRPATQAYRSPPPRSTAAR
jgi:hypothetical protein